jgi:hypothetical protein
MPISGNLVKGCSSKISLHFWPYRFIRNDYPAVFDTMYAIGQ